MRLVDGNILEGYDPVEVDGVIQATIKPAPTVQLFTFTAKVFIRNLFLANDSYALHQPILNTGAGFCFGGMGPNRVFDEYVSNTATTYNQDLQLGGFVCYLAGTPYYGVSKQRIGNSPSLQDANTGVYIVNTKAERNSLRNEIEGNSGGSSGENPDTRVWSNVSITAPAGKYLLRVASHKTTQADLSAGSLSYQKTSTHTLAVGGIIGNECEIEITAAGVIKVNGVAQSGTEIGAIEIADLTRPSLVPSAFSSVAVTGYVVDNDQSYSGAQIINEARIDLAQVSFSAPSANLNGVSLPSFTAKASEWATARTFTDHNGFFFFSSGIISAYVVTGIRSGIINMTAFSSYTLAGGGYIYPVLQGMNIGVFRNNGTIGSLDNSRTFLQGQITNNNVGLQGAFAVTSRGQFDVTDIYGFWNILIYADTKNFPLGRTDDLFYGVTDTCIATFNPTSDNYNIGISSSGAAQTVFTSPYNGQYNYSNIVVVSTVSSTIIGNGAQMAEKRGNTVQYGIVYYDHANRSSLTNTFVLSERLCSTTGAQTDDGTTITADGFKLYIPFYTETKTGGGQWKGSYPEISWQIKNQPPEWATHYQWVKYRPTPVFLQWTAKAVSYVDDDRNGTTYAAATKIGIDLESIIDYNTRWTDSNVSYTYTKGDRVRFIQNVDGSFVNVFVDVKIRDYDPAGIIYVDNLATMAQLQPGFLFEIYTPTPTAKEQIYYEFGECYEIGNPGAENRYHKGPIQDQNPNSYSGIPAKGTFSTGDTYYRIRGIPFTSGTKNWYIADASFSDFFVSNVSDIGRPNLVDDDYGQIRRPVTIYHSNLFVPETKINNLSQVYDINFETYEAKHGSIQKLYANQQRLRVYQELRVGNVLTGQVEVYSQQGGANQVSTTNNVLSTQIGYYSGNYGIAKNPESHAVYGDYEYFFDMNNGAPCRVAGDGITPIHNADAAGSAFYKMNNYFTDKAKLLLTATNPHVYGVFDNRFKEYILSFETAYNIVTFTESNSNTTFEILATYTEWAEGVTYNGTYAGQQIVRHNGNLYVCISNHTSTASFDNDVNSGYWAQLMYTNASAWTNDAINSYTVVIYNGLYYFSLLPQPQSTTYNPETNQDIWVLLGRSVTVESDVVTETSTLVSPGETLAFNETENRWTTFWPYLPDFMCYMGTTIATVKEGAFYTHNSNAVYENFYGIQYQPELWLVCNGEPSKVKVLRALSEESQDSWEAYEITNSEGQNSNVQYGDFEQIEGEQFYAPVLFDANTPNVTNPVIDGDPMRSRTFLVKLRNNKTTFTKLFAVNFLWNPSERSNK